VGHVLDRLLLARSEPFENGRIRPQAVTATVR
jgi:hypothetical protein